MTEDEIFGWHHRLNEHEFVQTPGDGEGQGSLVRCSGVSKSRTQLSDFTFTFGEGNGDPLQCSCLENPRDGGLLSMESHRVGHD